MSANYRLINIDTLDSEAQFPPELPIAACRYLGDPRACRQLLQWRDEDATRLPVSGG